MTPGQHVKHARTGETGTVVDHIGAQVVVLDDSTGWLILTDEWEAL